MNAVSLNDVLQNAVKLPSAPWLLPKLMQQLADPDSAADQLEALIRMDSGLASGTLRLANSAFFNNSVSCDCLSDAIVRLGFREIYRLATMTMSSGWLSQPVSGYGWEPGDLYRHSLTVAVAADLLARQGDAVDPEIAYTGGLLHDVGKLALAYSCGELFDQVREYQHQERCAWRVAENQVFGFDHTDVGAQLLERWQFPPRLVQVARFYPRPPLAAPESQSLVTIVHAAKHLALCVGTGVGEDGFMSELDEAALMQQGILPDALERLLPDVIERTARLLPHSSCV